MPQDDQINYNVKVRLDPNTQSTDSSVIYDVSEKKFALGTGTGITITNSVNNNILTADGTQTNIIGESLFRWVDGGDGGTDEGKAQIGLTATDYATPNQLLDVGIKINELTATKVPQAIFHAQTGTDNFPFLRIGLDGNTTNKAAAVIGLGSKYAGVYDFLQLGVFSSQAGGSFSPKLSMNIAGRFGIGEGTSPVLGKSYIDSNWQLFATRAFLNSDSQDEDEWAGTAAFQNSSTDITNKVKVLQLYAGAVASNYPEGGNTEPDSYTRFIEFYGRNDINENYLLGHISANNYVWANPGVQIYSVSDKRLKKDIKTLSVGLDKLLKIQPVEYKWKINKGKGYDKGFIAQDLHKIYPEAVQVPLTDNAEKDPWTISPTKLIPLLVKSIQDQQEIIKKLENRINNLENKIK